MNDLLSKFIRKIGVSKYDDLNEEEKNTFREWETALSGRQITDKEYRDFLETERELAINRMTEVDLSKEADIFRKVEVRFIKKIIGFLDMPKIQKVLLEKQIESRI